MLFGWLDKERELESLPTSQKDNTESRRAAALELEEVSGTGHVTCLTSSELYKEGADTLELLKTQVPLNFDLSRTPLTGSPGKSGNSQLIEVGVNILVLGLGHLKNMKVSCSRQGVMEPFTLTQ
jgi:hypothetical protein